MRISERALPGWDQPLEMLDACHGAIRHQLQSIWRLADHLPKNGVDTVARQAATEVLRYFSTAITAHHEDEERDLFPALLAAVPRTERRTVKALIDRLILDHQRMAVLREPIMARLFEISQGRAGLLASDEIEAFAALYIDHIRTESEILMPFARSFLSPEVLQSLSITMSVRRGLTLADLHRGNLAPPSA